MSQVKAELSLGHFTQVWGLRRFGATNHYDFMLAFELLIDMTFFVVILHGNMPYKEKTKNLKGGEWRIGKMMGRKGRESFLFD